MSGRKDDAKALIARIRRDPLAQAAPDLLAALRGMLYLIAGTSAEDEQPCVDARAAIAKATKKGH